MTAFRVNMRSLPSFSLLALQLCTAVTSRVGSSLFESVCPGQSFSIPRADRTYDLYFMSSTRGRSCGNMCALEKIANATHVFDPSYQYSPSEVFIPEVKKQHEGRYLWRSPDIYGIVSQVTHLGLRDCSFVQDLDYGVMLELAVPKEAALLQFTPSGSKDQKILWSRINAENERGARGTISRNRWTAYKIRFADAGRYAFLRESGNEISSTTARIREGSRWHDVDTQDSWEDRVGVPVSEAVVTFTDVQEEQHVIFKNSMMTEDAVRIFKGRLSINTHLDVLQFVMSTADSKAVGRYEVTEKKGTAFVIRVAGGYRDAPTIPDRTVPIAVAASILILFIFCCCVRRCCCKKKGSSSPAPVAEPAAATPSAPPDPPVYIHGPIPRSEPAYQPGARSRVEDICDSPPTHSYDSPPPSYDELMANGPEPYTPYVPYAPPEGPTGAYGVPVIPTPNAPSAPSAPDYQYQSRGLSETTSDFLSGSPLNTDTTDHTVYDSAKLNF